MALILAVQENESVYVDDRKITLLKIVTPIKYRVQVDGPMDVVYEITAKERTEIMPDVFLSAGIDASMDQAKLAFEAPRDRVILRQRLYERSKEGSRDDVV